MEEKTIQIRCEAKYVLPYTQLNAFQGEAKDLSPERELKLTNEIKNTGFAFAMHVWQNPDDQKWYIVDGHQRLRVITKLVEVDGYKCPDLPIVPVQADSYAQAKERVMQGMSQYGEINKQGLFDFIQSFELPPSELDRFSLPEVDLSAFKVEFFPDSTVATTVDGHQKGQIFSNDEIIEDAFQYYRAKGFPFKNSELFEMKQELNDLYVLPIEDCVRSNCGYSIADTYNGHRFEAAAQGMSSPVESFADDVKLRKALLMDLNAGSIKKHTIAFINLVNGTQACSNFRPAFAKMLYNQYCPENGRVFDSSTGYGGRLVGFLASHCAEYFGTDPNSVTFKANSALAHDLGKHKHIKLFNDPIEDLNIDEIKGSCDFSFTSPPYFTKELYAGDDKQSCVRYPEYDAWLQGFLKPMLQKNFDVLKPGALCVINIEDVKIKGETYALVAPTEALAKECGFKYIETKLFPLQTRTYMVDEEKITEEANESVLILQKP